MHKTILYLEDGKIFEGKSIGACGITVGEVCFTTSFTGYQHTITDPSFAEQIITFTFPHIGNVGVNDYDNERGEIFAKGIIIRESPSQFPSHSSSKLSLQSWLEKNKIIGICNIDTRELTKYLSENGPMKGVIYSQGKIDYSYIKQKIKSFLTIKRNELSQKVTGRNILTKNIQKENAKKIVIVDFGIKAGITEQFDNFDITVIPATENFAMHAISMQPAGIVLSNGPGDPAATAEYAVPEIKKILNTDISILAICLGHQLIAIALGCKTIKMKNGHRGSNHPVINLKTKKIEISSQNHGFVIDERSIPESVEVTHKSLFDGGVECIKVIEKNILSVQYHPEGCPGPRDSISIFKSFVDEIID